MRLVRVWRVARFLLVQQDYIRALLNPLQDDFARIRRDIEIANLEVG